MDDPRDPGTERTGGAPNGADSGSGAAVGHESADASPGSCNSAGGWRSQPLPLKLVLAVSLVFIVLGVYRCSMELTPSDGPRTILVERASVNVPDSLAVVPPDSLAALMTRLFARGLRSAWDASVSVGEDPAAWAVVRVHLNGTPEGLLGLSSVASSALGGRTIAAATVVDSAYKLREMTAEAARMLADEMDLAGGAGSAEAE